MKTITSLRISRANLSKVLVAVAVFIQTVIIFLSIIKPLAVVVVNTRDFQAAERSANRMFLPAGLLGSL